MAIYVIWARMGHTSPTAMPRNTVWKTKRGKLKHYALVICTLQDAYMYVYAYTYDICIFTYICIMRSGYIRHLVYSSSSSSESPYFPFYCSSLVTAMSRYKSPAKSFVRFLGIILGENTNSETFSPIFSLISVVCLFGWDPQIWNKENMSKSTDHQCFHRLNLKKSKRQLISKPRHKLSSIIIFIKSDCCEKGAKPLDFKRLEF